MNAPNALRIRFLPGALILFLIGSAGVCSEDGVPRGMSAPPGDTRFDPADRLAITNLFGAMVRGLDERDIEILGATVAPEFAAEYRVPGSPVAEVSGRDRFLAMMAERFKIFDEQGIRRRHILSPPLFLEQTPDSAHVAIHFLTCTTTAGKDWRPFASSLGEFWAVKRSGVWAFTKQLEVPDASLDLSNSVLLPGSEIISK